MPSIPTPYAARQPVAEKGEDPVTVLVTGFGVCVFRFFLVALLCFYYAFPLSNIFSNHCLFIVPFLNGPGKTIYLNYILPILKIENQCFATK